MVKAAPAVMRENGVEIKYLPSAAAQKAYRFQIKPPRLISDGS
jgi:hypothetical protein